ncbi:MAG TPA: phosphorylase [Acidobacteriaceae bacterium]
MSAAGEATGAGLAVAGEAGRVAVVAALPREIAGLVRGTRPEAGLLKRGIHLHRVLGVPGAVVVAAGMGAARVTLAVEAALAAGGVEAVISAGLAGACAPGLQAGTVLEANTVVDARTGERFESVVKPSSEDRRITLATVASVASVREKRRLLESYGAVMVDMEAATVARLAMAHGLAFRAIKGISDEHDFDMEVLAAFTGKDGQFRTGAFALHTALRPATWGRTMKLGRDSTRALHALEEAVRRTIHSPAARE